MTQSDRRTGISDHTNVTPVMHGDLPVASRRDFGKDLVGPPRGDQHWHAREQTGFSAEHCRIDWEH